MNSLAPVLLADDDPNHSLLVQEAFKRAHLPNPLHVVTDGELAISYLKGAGPYANRAEHPLPAVLLLDIKMPKVNGFEVLQWLRQQPTLRRLRVVMLTNSDEIQDVNTAHEFGANSFLVKPIDFQELIALIRSIQEYWLSLSQIPEI